MLATELCTKGELYAYDIIYSSLTPSRRHHCLGIDSACAPSDARPVGPVAANAAHHPANVGDPSGSSLSKF